VYLRQRMMLKETSGIMSLKVRAKNGTTF